MSHRRKHVHALANELAVTLEDGDVVCRVTAVCGANLVEVERGDDDAGVTTLVRVPNKFKKLAWFRAGTHVVARFVDARELEGRDDVKVTGELRRVLYAEQVKEMRRRDDGTWPKAFESEERGTGCALRELAGALEEDEARARATARDDGEARDGSADEDDDEGSDDGLPPLVANRNRRRVRTYVDSDESSDSD